MWFVRKHNARFFLREHRPLTFTFRSMVHKSAFLFSRGAKKGGGLALYQIIQFDYFVLSNKLWSQPTRSYRSKPLLKSSIISRHLIPTMNIYLDSVTISKCCRTQRFSLYSHNQHEEKISFLTGTILVEIGKVPCRMCSEPLVPGLIIIVETMAIANERWFDNLWYSLLVLGRAE